MHHPAGERSDSGVNALPLAASDIAAYAERGWTVPRWRLEEGLLAPVAAAALALAMHRPRQEQLSGAHNPFGPGAARFDAWKFLDVCESASLLDALAALIGPDIVLWDSELYLDAGIWAAEKDREGRHWPADPLAGLVVELALDTGKVQFTDILRVHETPRLVSAAPHPSTHYVIRYMPATSHYNRNPHFAANRLAMEERPLVNYLTRPIWLARGSDRAGSDFAAGFAPMAPMWAAAKAGK